MINVKRGYYSVKRPYIAKPEYVFKFKKGNAKPVYKRYGYRKKYRSYKTRKST